MKALCLIYTSDEWWAGLPAAGREEILHRYRAFAEEARAAGKLLDAAELHPAATATTVRVRGGETRLADGPFEELPLDLGGYFLLEVDSLDEAVELAARIPGAEHGAVEVRPEYAGSRP